MDYHLLTFVTVVDKKNFTRAAEALHISQSAVTLSIKALEKDYDLKLLDRNNKYVRLTKAGEILYHHAKKILSYYDRMNRLIDDLSHSASGILTIGSSYTFGEYLLPKLISQFNGEYPLIKPNISIRNSRRIISKLLRGELDLGIVEGITEHPKLHIQPFAQDEMVLIVSSKHPLAMKQEINLNELDSETWIIREEGSGTRQAINQLFSTNNFSPNEIRSFGSSQIIKESVEAGLGISILSIHTIRKELELKTLRTLRIKDNPIIRNFCYVIPKMDFQPKSVDLFLTFLQNSYTSDLWV
ncbi:LysR family transcriptional regulator [Bacillus sp. sid0103]|uniref:LysR family transcriptional regulator n=1 Tax=Bacillus sp. sid0103 TaxID=2856337 RepID=UPI001C461785|nr:LysR family transcriptional regulator [Bacillus sp. sid0103]MBV7505315.1 LysR family transcriptional regulator [Bacillus sp. sid0103]